MSAMIKNRQQGTSWPTRLHLVGLDGRVVYGGGLGPFDFKPAKLENAIEQYLGEIETKTA